MPIRRVPAAARAVDLLRLLADLGRPASVASLARGLDLPRTSVAGICEALADERMLVRTADGRYWLGTHVVELAAASATTLERPLRVGLLMVSRANPFYTAMYSAATRELAGVGGQLMVRDAREDAELQRAQWHELIDDGADVIIVDSVDTGPHLEQLAHARRAGVPTIAIGSRLDGVDASVTSDNNQAGLLAGRHLARALSGDGRVAILDGLEKNANADRVAGFREAVHAASGLTVVAHEHGGHDTAEAGAAAMRRVLEGPEPVDAVFAVCDPIAMGAVAAQEAAGTRVPIVSVDARSDAIDNLLAGGPIIASVAQDPGRLVVAAISIARDLARGRPTMQGAHLVPVRIVDGDSAREYERWG